MMYVKYPPSQQNVEDLRAERGIAICHETVPFSLLVQFKISGSVGWIAPLLGGVGRALAVVSLLLEPVAAGLAAGKPASDCRAAQVRVRGYT